MHSQASVQESSATHETALCMTPTSICGLACGNSCRCVLTDHQCIWDQSNANGDRSAPDNWQRTSPTVQHYANSEMLTPHANASAAHASMWAQMHNVRSAWDSCAVLDALTGAVLCCSNPHLKACCVANPKRLHLVSGKVLACQLKCTLHQIISFNSQLWYFAFVWQLQTATTLTNARPSNTSIACEHCQCCMHGCNLQLCTQQSLRNAWWLYSSVLRSKARHVVRCLDQETSAQQDACMVSSTYLLISTPI